MIAPAPIAGTATVPHLHPKLASTSPPATCTGTQNMLTNASFEAGTVNGTPTGNWASYPASSVTETVKNDLTNGVPTAREGENYLQASTTTAGNAVEQLVSYTTSLYDSFTFSIWLKSADGSTLSGSVKIIGQVPDHAQQEPDSTPFSVAGSWTEVSAPLNVTQTGHTQIAVDIVLNTTNKTYDIDAGQLVKAGLQNASFEMNANNTSPTSWTPTGTGTNAVVYQDSSAIDGTRLLQANTTDSSGAASIYQTVSITPAANQSFTVSVWLRSINSTSLGGRLVVWGLGGTGNESGVTTFTVGQQWTVETASLQMTYGNHTSVEAQLYLDTTGNTYDIDSFDLVNTCLQNASFEQGNLPNWSVTTSPLVQTAVYTGGRDDTHFLQANSAGYGGNIYQTPSSLAPAAGTSWNFSAWIQSNTGQSLNGRLAIFANGGTAENAVTYWTVSGTGWNYLSVGINPVNTGHTSMTVAIYLDSTTYNYNIDAASLQGANQSAQGAPGIPQSVAANQAGNQASLTWTQNPIGGGATNWIIYPYLNGNLQVANEQPISDPNDTIRSANFNLPGSWFGQSVTFGVAGANAYGTGPMSSPLGFTPVSPPTEVQAVGGKSLVTVNWTAPTSGQGSITGYSVQAYNATTGATVGSAATTASTVSSTQVTGLTNGTHYLFKVTANTASGTANASVPTPSNVATAAAPATITSLPSKTHQAISGIQNRPESVATADLDGSGHPAIISTGGGGIQVNRNDGTGALSAASAVYSIDPVNHVMGSWALAVGDLNGDDKPDVVTANSTGSACTVAVLLGTGNADPNAFQTAATYSLPSCTQADGIAVGDVRGTGHLDVVVGGKTTKAAYWVLTNDGTGTLTVLSTNTISATDQPEFSDVQLVDLGDGHLDLIGLATYAGNNSVLVFHGPLSSGAFTGPDSYIPGTLGGTGVQGANWVAFGYLKGRANFPYLIASTAQTVYAWPGTGSGKFQAQQQGQAPTTLFTQNSYTGGGVPYTEGKIVDVNGDGIPDIVVGVGQNGNCNPCNQSLEVHLNNGDATTFTSFWTTAQGPDIGVAVGDLNGDGKPDFVLSEPAGTGALVEDFLNPGNWQGIGPGGPVDGWNLIGGVNFCAACAQRRFQESQLSGDPITPATGALSENFTDLSIPGRLPLMVTRSYDSTKAGVFGAFGWGWSSNLLMSLSTDPNTGIVTISQENGSTVQFQPSGADFVPLRDVPATLTSSGTGSSLTYTFTRQGTQVLTFNNVGQLTEAQDLNAVHASPTSYGTVYTYNQSTGLLSSITGAGGNCTPGSYVRCLTFTWSNGVITQITDNEPTGNRTTSYNYNGIQELTSVVDVTSQTTTFAYDDTTHHLTNLYTPNCSAAGSSCNGGNGVQNDYDSQGRVDWQKDNLGNKTSYSYTASTNGWTVQITAPAVSPNCSSGCVTQEVYAGGLLQSVTYGYGTSSAATWSYQYDGRGVGVIQITDPNNHVQKYTLDSVGNRLTYQDGNQSSSACLTTGSSRNCTAWTYNSFNEPLTMTDAAGVTTTNTFDSTANPTRTCTPLPGGSCGSTPSNAQVVTYNHTDLAHPGDVTSMVDGDGNQWSFGLDSRGYQVEVKDPLGNVSASVYNDYGFATATYTPKAGCTWGSTPPTGCSSSFETQNTFNARGQVLTTTDPLGHVTKNTYDLDGNPATFQDGNQSGFTCQTSGANRECTAFTFNLNEQQTKVTRADGTTLVADLNADGTVLDEKDGKGNAILTYTRDPLGRVIEQTDADSRSTSFGLDGVGNVCWTYAGVSTNGCLSPPTGTSTITNQWDAGNRLSQVTYSDGSTSITNILYDPDNRRTGLTHGTATPSWTWDVLGRLTGTTDENGTSVGYGWNFRNLVTSITYPGNHTVNRGYDTVGRLHTIQDWLSTPNTTTFGWDVNSNLTTDTFQSGATDTYGLNNADQMTSISDVMGGTTIFGATYTRDNAGQLTSDSSQPTNQGAYAYTNLNQLCYAGSANTSACSSPPASSYPYSLDAAGNLTTMENAGHTGTNTQTFTNGDALVSSGASTTTACNSAPPTGTNSYCVDGRGNRTAAIPHSGGSTCDAYNLLNQLTSVVTGAGTTCSGPTTVGSYTYDAMSLRLTKTVSGTTTQFDWDQAAGLPLLLDEKAGTNSPTYYIYGPNHLPIEQIDPSGVAHFYQHDQLGSTVALSSASGVKEDGYTWDPYGNAVTSSGSVPNSLQFAGEYHDAESGLLYLRARYYDPTTAQFLTRDPAVAETGSPYAYVAGNPLNATDSSGLDSYWQDGPSQNVTDLQNAMKALNRRLTEYNSADNPDPGHSKAINQARNRVSKLLDKVRNDTSCPDELRAQASEAVEHPDTYEPPSSNPPADTPTGGDPGGSGGNGRSSRDDSNTNKAVAGGVTLAGVGVVLWWIGKAASPLCGPAVVVCAVAA